LESFSVKRGSREESVSSSCPGGGEGRDARGVSLWGKRGGQKGTSGCKEDGAGAFTSTGKETLVVYGEKKKPASIVSSKEWGRTRVGKKKKTAKHHVNVHSIEKKVGGKVF